MISLVDSTASVQTITGIEFLGTNIYTLNVYYNTCFIGGLHTGGDAGATTSVAIRTNSANATHNFKNNIAINKRTGGNVNHIGFAFIPLILPSTFDINYNCYFASGSANSFAAFWQTTGYNTLSTYKTAVAPQEQNTIFKDVSFNSLTNLHLVAPSDGDPDLAGIPISGITTDFDGQLRDLVLPYRGADEATTIPVELVSFTYNISGNDIILNWSTATELNNYGFEIWKKQNNSDWQNIGFVAGAGNSTNINSYSFTDRDLKPGYYSYKLRQVDFSGASKFYELTETVNLNFPDQFELHQNFPNPFNPTTKISWQLPVSGRLTIKLFDVLGREIETIVNGYYEAGKHSVEFDGSKLTSGIYIYELRTGSYRANKKMTIIK